AVRNIRHFNADQIVIAGRDEFDVLAIARDRIDVPPTVALTRPQEPFAAVDPLHVAARQTAFVPINSSPRDVHAGGVLFGQDRTDFARADVAEHHDISVLQPVELLNDDLVGVGRPLHPWQIVIARIARNAEPLRLSARRADDAYARGRVSLAGFRVWE